MATIVPNGRQLGRRVLTVTAVLALLVAAVAALPGLDEVRRRFEDAVPGWLAAALVLEAASCLAFVAVYRGVLCDRLPWRMSYQVGMAAQGANVLLPAGGAGGLALGAWALSRTGVPAERLARRTVAFFLLTSSVNFAAAVAAGALLSVGLLAGGAALALTAIPAVLAAACIAAVLAAPRVLGADRAPVADGAGRVARGLAWGRTALIDGIRDAVALVRSRNTAVIGGAIGYMAFDVAALAAAFAALGDVPPAGVLLLAYVLGQLGGLIPVPGGVGGADGGLIAALVLYGTPLAGAAAAVLAYRAFQLGLPAVLGAVAVLRLPQVTARAAVPAPCGPGTAVAA